MELSHLLISRVAGQRPSRELAARFALYVLARLPYGGFVLDSQDVARWLHVASVAEDYAPLERPRPSWSGRLRKVFGQKGQMPEHRSQRPLKEGPAARRAADRRYLGFVAGEAHRLARRLRPSRPTRSTAPRGRPEGSR